jgi:hypothetical protein
VAAAAEDHLGHDRAAEHDEDERPEKLGRRFPAGPAEHAGFSISRLRTSPLGGFACTSTADSGIGEWGFAALVEADGHRILFDTGARPDTVLRNARALGVELFPGVWLTGPVPCVHSERNWSGTGRIRTDQGAVEDSLPAASWGAVGASFALDGGIDPLKLAR